MEKKRERGTVRHRETESERRRTETRVGGGRGSSYRDKDGKLQAIWLIRLRGSNPGDLDVLGPSIPYLPTAFVVYQPKKGKTKEGTERARSRRRGLSTGKSDVRYIRARLAGRLGFFERTGRN